MNGTIEYYDSNAEKFIKETVHVEFAGVQERFLRLLPEKPHILDFGCGSGRDTVYFLKKGCSVDATDGSEKICREASVYTGMEVRHMMFHQLDESAVYDGIWACASILHVPEKELPDIIERMHKALRSGGVIYTSFKYGEYEGERRGRYFTDFTEEKFRRLMEGISGLAIEELWITGDARPERGEEKWLNIILRRTDAD